MKRTFGRKFLSALSSFSLLLNQLLPVVAVLAVPTPAYAQQEAVEPVSFDKTSNSFSFPVIDGESVNYLLAYRTDKDQTEVVLGSQQPIYAGTCSENGHCVDHKVRHSILKLSSGDETRFALEQGQVVIVSQTKISGLDLTDEENSWLVNYVYQPEVSPSPTLLPSPSLEPSPTPTPTPEPVKVWSANENGSYTTVNPVSLDTDYVSPFNDKLIIKFTKLPVTPSQVTLREIPATFDLGDKEQVGSAYEITSAMPDGEFTYDLTLPIPADTDKSNLKVSYAETLDELSSAQIVSQTQEVKDDSVTVSALDHFTVFVLVANPSGVANGMLSAIADTYIKQDSGGNDNYGGSGPIYIYSQSTDKNRRILVKFDLSSIPKNATINSALLKLKMTNAPGTNRQYDVYRVTGSWSEDTVTWNTKPAFAGSATSFVTSGMINNVVLSWNVTTDVQAFLSGTPTPNYGWLIRDNAEDSTSVNTNQAGFASKENGTNSNRPQLSVDFSLASPANTSPASTGGWNSPSAQAAVTTNSGDNNGYGTNPTYAFAGDGTYAVDTNSGSNDNSDCSGIGVDRHLFYNYGLSIPTGASIDGIEVRQDLKVSSVNRSPLSCVQLSWDGGTSWTNLKQASLTTTDLTPYYFGGSSDLWERSWSASDFSNSNFRVRVANGDTDNLHSDTDFSLDWIPVRVYYTADTTAPETTIDSGPSGTVNSNSATFNFSADETSTFECQLDGGGFSSCTSPKTYNGLGEGSHTFDVRATDLASNTDPTPASQSWTVDTQAPYLVSKTTFSGWYNANQTSTFTYTDDGSGIVSGIPVTCDITTEGTAQTCSVTPNVCDAVGNCNTTLVTSNGADIDKSLPTDPTVGSTSHTTSSWSKDNTVDVTWSGATDSVYGVDGFYTEWNTSATTIAGPVIKEYEETDSSETSPALADGQNHYFHIATVDNAGNWTSTAHLGPFWIDTTAPNVTVDNLLRMIPPRRSQAPLTITERQ